MQGCQQNYVNIFTIEEYCRSASHSAALQYTISVSIRHIERVNSQQLSIDEDSIYEENMAGFALALMISGKSFMILYHDLRRYDHDNQC